MHIKLAADEKGKILALEGDNYIDHGPYSEFGDLLTMRLSQFVGAGVDIPNIRNKSQTVCTNHAYGAAFRDTERRSPSWAGDIAMDIMAEKMGIDPFEFRAMNCYKESAGLHYAERMQAGCVLSGRSLRSGAPEVAGEQGLRRETERGAERRRQI